MAQQELDEAHGNPGAPVVVPAQGPPAGAVLPTTLAQLVEVLRANFQNPLTVSPQDFLTTVFEADLAATGLNLQCTVSWPTCPGEATLSRARQTGANKACAGVGKDSGGGGFG